MLYKIGTFKEINQIIDKVPEEVYKAILHIVTVLDDNYGADRDIDSNDGGFVLLATNIRDIPEVNEQYIQLERDSHECIDLIKCENNEPFVNALFMCNNEFGINFFAPKSITPMALLDDLE